MKYFLSFIISLGCWQVASAQTAIYQDGVLTIPNIAVVEDSGGTYYSDIRLQLEPNGDFKLTAAQQQNLVAVDSVVANVMESLPVQVSVTVNGNKSVPCVRLLEPAVARKDSKFIVTLAESVLGPAESCIAIIDPFETTISLDVKGLSAGTYDVEVNGVKTSFLLEMDIP
jgi:hypothetical protein